MSTVIKILNCNFLALSATIGNIEFLKETFNKIHPNKQIHYIEYNKRFINHQRWIYNNKSLVSIHPLCSININDLNDNFIDNITYDELNMLNEIKTEHVKKVESLKKELQDITLN